MNKKILATLLSSFLASAAFSTPFTETTPILANNPLPAGVTKVGGIVLNARGFNGASLTSQLAASSLFEGFAGSNPQTIGTQTGLAPSLALLGGGFSQLAVRVTLFDGDTANNPYTNFDYNNNTFLLNGITFGNWSAVNAQNTDATGTVVGTMSGGGFRDNTLDTGWFYSNNAVTLASIFASIGGGGSLVYSLHDTDPGDNYYDFKQGVNGGLINTNVPPVVTPSVPDGGTTFGLLALSVVGMLVVRRRRNA